MKKKGYTLFELLVTISIIAILTALATVSYSAVQKKARDSRRVSDLENIRKAQEQYYMLNNSTYSTECTMGAQWTNTAADGTVTMILSAFPSDPKSGGYTVDKCLANAYCICGVLDNQTGNSTNDSCTFVGAGGTGPDYCVSNQQ